MDHDNQQHPQNEQENDKLERDLDQERVEFQRMIERQSEASRKYTKGKLLST